MRITEGENPKHFQVKDINNQTISLEQFNGQYLLLSFYRYAGCPLCNLRLHEIMTHSQSFKEKGLQVVSFFESSKDSILTHINAYDAPFPIIPDPERKIYKLYKVESSALGYLKGLFRVSRLYEALHTKKYKVGKPEGDVLLLPADFIIGPNGRVLKAYYGKDAGDHLPVDVIYSLLNS